MNELPDDIYAQIQSLSERGNIAMDAGQPEEAIGYWQEALKLLPQPEAQWDAALWLHASIGDAQRSLGDLPAALSSFRQAERSADGYAHPFVQIGLGSTLYELDEKEAATEHLLRAYMMEGADIFEPDGAEYLQHLKRQGLV